MATATTISSTGPRTPGHVFVLVGAVAAVAVMSAFVVTPQSSPPTTYGASSVVLALLGFAAGYGLLTVAVVAALLRPSGSTAVVTGALGTVWLANDWIGWAGGPALARSIAMVLVPFAVPLLVHLTLAAASGRVRGRPARVALVATYLVSAAYSAGQALFRDPFLDLGCWNNCRDNTFLVRADRDLVATLDSRWRVVVIVIAAATVVLVVARLVRASPVARRATALVLVAAAIALLGQAWHVLLLAGRSERPTDPAFRAAFVVRATGLLAVAAGVGWGARRIARTRASIARLVHDRELGAAGALAPALARSFGDESLDVAYWLPVSQRWVDAAGSPYAQRADDGRVATTIARHGTPVARVLHDPDLAPPRDVGAATRLAIDNERLRAEVLAQLADLQASRARIVATADATRRRLERDLHDGAQQRLLAASFELRQAESAAARDGDDALAAVVASASAQVQDALTDLRDLAHGIYPAILVEAGLEPAVRQLADRAPFPVELDRIAVGRVAHLAESTAYAVVSSCVHTGARLPGAAASVAIEERDDRLAVEVTLHRAADADPWPTPDLLVDLGDRVGALGGSIAVIGSTIRAEVPCAW